MKSDKNSEENYEKFTHDELEAMRKADLSAYRLMLHANLCLSDEDKCPNCGSDLWAYLQMLPTRTYISINWQRSPLTQ